MALALDDLPDDAETLKAMIMRRLDRDHDRYGYGCAFAERLTPRRCAEPARFVADGRDLWRHVPKMLGSMPIASD